MGHTSDEFPIPGSDGELVRCEERIGYRFTDRALLVHALTHASGASHRLVSNERLEFLGDAILGAVVCETLYRKHTELLEGDLTKIKSVVVSRKTCANVSRNLGLDEFLILGKGMVGATLPSSLLAGVFESLVAAIYLDGGQADAAAFITKFLGPEIKRATVGGHGGNYKSVLQQRAQRDLDATPKYVLLDEKGPDHNKCFMVAAMIGEKKTFAPAWGRNKKDAEQRAAQNALAELDGEAPPYVAD